MIAGLGRSPGEGNGHPLQYSGLENSMDRGAWEATVQGAEKSQTRPTFRRHLGSLTRDHTHILYTPRAEFNHSATREAPVTAYLVSTLLCGQPWIATFCPLDSNRIEHGRSQELKNLFVVFAV